MMFTLERNDAAGANANFPTKLSETGLFTDVTVHEMADGIARFSPNARQWQDGATAEHFIALPGLSSVTLFDKPRPLARSSLLAQLPDAIPEGRGAGEDDFARLHRR